MKAAHIAADQLFSGVSAVEGDAGGFDIVKEGREPTKSTVAFRDGLEPSELDEEDSMPNPTVLFSVIATLVVA